MEIDDQSWSQIRRIFRAAFRSSLHYSIATVNDDGTPHVTPVGGLVLNHDPSGYFMEILTTSFKNNQQVCILAVNSSPLFWIKSIMSNGFSTSPGVRLMGIAGERREATPQEVRMFHTRIRSLRGFLRILPITRFKGYDRLWGNIKYVRDIRFTSYEPLNLGRMSNGLLSSAKITG